MRTAQGQFIDLSCLICGALDMGGDLGNRRCHFGHRRGGHVSFVALALKCRFSLSSQTPTLLGENSGLICIVTQTAECSSNARAFTDYYHLQLRGLTVLIGVGLSNQLTVECMIGHAADFRQSRAL